MRELLILAPLSDGKAEIEWHFAVETKPQMQLGNRALAQMQIYLILKHIGPSQVAQLVGMSTWYDKVAGLILGQGTYKNQPMSA